MRGLTRRAPNRCVYCSGESTDTHLVTVCGDCLDAIEQLRYLATHHGRTGWTRAAELVLFIAAAWVVWLAPAALVYFLAA